MFNIFHSLQSDLVLGVLNLFLWIVKLLKYRTNAYHAVSAEKTVQYIDNYRYIKIQLRSCTEGTQTKEIE